MSKAAPKAKAKPSKDSKGKTTSTEKQPATLFEIVPGKFNENDWNLMLETDDSQDFVWEIIDEVFDNTIKIIYDNYLEKQAIPYTICTLHEAILHIIDWQFLTKDKNDDLTEQWVQDLEPDACVIDNWAQGYVQAVVVENDFKKNKHESETNISEKDENRFFLEELNRIIDQPEFSQDQNDLSKKSSRAQFKLNDIEMPQNSSRSQKGEQKPTSKVNQLAAVNKKKGNFLNTIVPTEAEQIPETPRPINMRVKAIPEIKKLEEQINKAPVACQSLLKTLLSRPVNMREIGIDPYGNVETITKLEFDKSTFNNIKARFTIMTESKYTINANSRSKNVVSSSIDITEEKSKHIPHDEEYDYVLEPAPGVSFTINNSTRVGPKKVNTTSKQQLILEKSEYFLQPVRQNTKTEMSSISVEKLLGHPNTKNGKQAILNQFKQIPPINHNQNNQTSVN